MNRRKLFSFLATLPVIGIFGAKAKDWGPLNADFISVDVGSAEPAYKQISTKLWYCELNESHCWISEDKDGSVTIEFDT